MLVTIIKSDVVTDTTIKTIETFAKIRKLSRNLNSISAEQINTGVRGFNIWINILLEEVIDIQPTSEIKDDNVTGVETKIGLNLCFAKGSRVVKSKKWLALDYNEN